MLRAINRIAYRYFNDGDYYWTGYGCETAGPAHSFLYNASHPLRTKVRELFDAYDNDRLLESKYVKVLEDVLEVILDYIERQDGNYSENILGDMLDYEPVFENYEDDDEEDEDDYWVVDDEWED